jgi:hypothetical protein
VARVCFFTFFGLSLTELSLMPKDRTYEPSELTKLMSEVLLDALEGISRFRREPKGFFKCRRCHYFDSGRLSLIINLAKASLRDTTACLSSSPLLSSVGETACWQYTPFPVSSMAEPTSVLPWSLFSCGYYLFSSFCQFTLHLNNADVAMRTLLII